MTTELLQHMVEETQACVDIALPSAIQIEADGNLGFVGIPLDNGHAGRVAQVLVDGCPTRGGEGGPRVGLLSY